MRFADKSFPTEYMNTIGIDYVSPTFATSPPTRSPTQQQCGVLTTSRGRYIENARDRARRQACKITNGKQSPLVSQGISALFATDHRVCVVRLVGYGGSGTISNYNLLLL